jgi:tetratricopeptide (TPR) repeat protein
MDRGHALERWGVALLLLVCLAGVAGLYSPSLGGGFTTWDDPDAIFRDRSLRAVGEGGVLDRAQAILTLFNPQRIRLGDYAPIAQLSLALDLAVGEGSPIPFHVTQLLLHLIAVAGVVLVAQRLGAGPVAACLGALLFAVHPVQVEPTAWISCRGRMLASVFGLFALLSQLGARARPGWAAFWLALGLLSKISALAYFPAVLVAGGAFRRQLPVVVVAAGAVGVLVASRLGPAAPESVELGRTLLLPDGLARYLHLLVVPGAASIFHAVDELGDGLGWGVLPGALAVVGLLALAPSRSRRVAGALLAASALLYLPNVVVRSGVSPVADRYLYEPLAAIAWLVATAAVVPRVRTVGAVACAVVIVALLPANLARQRVWSDPAAVWADATQKYPDSPFVWFQLGIALERAEDSAGAEIAYRSHLERNPTSAAGFNNLGRVLARQGRTEESLPLLDRSLELDPEIGPVWFNRGVVLLDLERQQEALETLRHAVELQPNLAEGHNAIGVLLMEQGSTAEARASFEAAIRARPDRPNAHYNLGWLLARQGHPREAESHYLEAIRLSPGYKRAHNNLALVYLRTGRAREAIVSLERVLEIDPGFEEARVNLGNAYFQVAVGEWAEVLRQNPGRQGVAGQLERLREAGLLQMRERQDGARGTEEAPDAAR